SQKVRWLRLSHFPGAQVNNAARRVEQHDVLVPLIRLRSMGAIRTREPFDCCDAGLARNSLPVTGYLPRRLPADLPCKLIDQNGVLRLRSLSVPLQPLPPCGDISQFILMDCGKLESEIVVRKRE